MKRGFHAGLPQVSGIGIAPLSEGDLDQIHLASLEVLERAGVWVEDDDALDVFADRGCRVDRETRTVKIPGGIVEDAIRWTPPRFTLHGRDPRNSIELGGDRVHFMNFAQGLRVNDLETGENRPSLSADVAACSRLVDWASEIDMDLDGGVYPGDVRPESAPLATPAGPYMCAIRLKNHSKPLITGGQSELAARTNLKLFAAVAGGMDALREKPMMCFSGVTVSPLQLPRDATFPMLVGAREGFPVSSLAMPMAGGSSPQTLAGTLVMNNVEVLASLAMVQLAARGTPFLGGTSLLAMDLRYGAAVLGTPEAALLSAGVAQMSRRYGIPIWVQGL
jgi:trimethylamine---corrinoid protein Co-methyltransferase